MPSVSSIFAVFDKGTYQKVQVGRNLGPFPSIDPLDAFYLVNPGGDLVRTQIKFENYFRDKNIEVLHLFKFDKSNLEEYLCLLVLLLAVLSTNLVNIYVFFFCHVTLQGKAGSKPVVKEMISALESHDLFIYLGHGSGKA